MGELSAESDLRVFRCSRCILSRSQQAFNGWRRTTRARLSLYRGLNGVSAQKEGKMKLLPLFYVRSRRSVTKVYVRKDSCNSRRSSAFDCLRLCFFLLWRTLAGGGSSFRTRASPWGILLVFIFDTALNGVSFLPSLRYPLQCHCGEISFPR